MLKSLQSEAVRSRWTVVLALTLASGGCDWLRGVSDPEEIRIELSSSQTSQAVVVRSTYFQLQPDPECPETCPSEVLLVESDTSIVSLPFNSTFPFTERRQYFVEAFPAVPDTTELAMKISIDGKEWYSDFRALGPDDGEGNRETLRFVYQFSEPRLPGR